MELGRHGRRRVIDGRPFLSFDDYLKWRDRRSKGDIKSEMQTGTGVSSWNQWVEEHGGEAEATLGGVKARKLDRYLDGYRDRVCWEITELTQETRQRESALESLKVGKPDSGEDERFRRRVEHWRELALNFLPEIYDLTTSIDSISRRYFDGHQPLFPAVFEVFDQLLALSRKTVGIYNEALAGEIERAESILGDARDGLSESPLAIDLAVLDEDVKGPAKGQMDYMVDMAKADALELLGEDRKAVELVERHV